MKSTNLSLKMVYIKLESSSASRQLKKSNVVVSRMVTVHTKRPERDTYKILSDIAWVWHCRALEEGIVQNQTKNLTQFKNYFIKLCNIDLKTLRFASKYVWIQDGSDLWSHAACQSTSSPHQKEAIFGRNNENKTGTEYILKHGGKSEF